MNLEYRPIVHGKFPFVYLSIIGHFAMSGERILEWQITKRKNNLTRACIYFKSRCGPSYLVIAILFCLGKRRNYLGSRKYSY